MSDEPFRSGFYRPLVVVSYWLDYQVWGNNPLGYHAFNLLLYLSIALGVFGLSKALGLENGAAWVGALFFAFHPIQNIAVGNIASRTDLMATSFLLFGLLLWLSKGFLQKSSGVCLLFLALLCKESAVAGPVLAIMCSWWQKADKRPQLKHIWAVTLVIPVYVLLRSWALQGSDPVRKIPSFVDWKGSYVTWSYLTRIIIPTPQAPVENLAYPGLFWVLLTGLLLVGMFLVVLYPGVHHRARLLMGWFLVTIAPVTDWLPLDVRFSDLLLFLPFVAVSIAFGWLMWKINWFRLVQVVLLLCMTSSVYYTYQWKDEATLWRWGLSLKPQNANFHVQYGVALLRKAEVNKGIWHLKKAVQLGPKTRELCYAHFNLGVFYERNGRVQKAVYHFRKTYQLQKNQTHQKALHSAYNRLGVYWYSRRKLAQAESVFRAMLRLSPRNTKPLFNLSMTLLYQHRLKEAKTVLLNLLKEHPDHLRGQIHLLRILSKQKNFVQLNKRAKFLLKKVPNHPIIWGHLGISFMKMGQLEQAQKAFQRSLQFKKNDSYIKSQLQKVRRLQQARKKGDKKKMPPTTRKTPSTTRKAAPIKKPLIPN